MIAVLEMAPSSGGRFEVSLDDELLFSKAATGRHPTPGEIAALFRTHLGPELLS